MRKLTYGALAFGLTPLALAANAAAQEQFNLSIGVRETNQAAGTPIFSDGGSTGSIEFIARDGRTITADGTWQQFTFTFGTDPVNFFAGSPQPPGGAPNQLDGAMGVFEQIRVRNLAGTTDPIRLYIDDVVHTVGTTPNLLTDFDDPLLPTTNGSVLLRQPSFSGSSSIAPAPAPNTSAISTDFALSGAQSLKVNWEYGNNLTTTALRLTTFNTANFPNPLLDFAAGNTLSFWALAVVDHPVQGWITNGDGNWSDPANWADGLVPNAANAAAKFLGTITAPVTVTVDTPIMVNNMQFNNANRYTIAGTNELSMEGNNTIPVTISVANGSHTISAPVTLNNNFGDGQNLNVFVVNAADTLTVNSVVKGAANTFRSGLVKNGAGKIELTTLTVDTLAVSAGTADILAGGAVTLGHTAAIDPAINGLTVSSGAVLNVGGASFSADQSVSNGTINHSAGATTLGAVSGSGTLNVSGGTFAAASLRQSTINLTGGSIEVLPSGAPTSILRANTLLTIAPGTLLKMNDNDMIVNYPTAGPSPEFELRDKVLLYRDGTGTEGIGFTETVEEDTVLAFGEAAELGITEFNGITVDATTVVGKFTYYGDANFDGQVTTDDYVAVDLGLGTGDSWVQGDFDLNGAVTTDDYVVVDLNLGKGTTNPLAYAEEQAAMIALHTEMFGQSYVDKLAYASEFGWVAASVPEPGAMSLLALGAVGILSRRRRGN